MADRAGRVPSSPSSWRSSSATDDIRIADSLQNAIKYNDFDSGEKKRAIHYNTDMAEWYSLTDVGRVNTCSRTQIIQETKEKIAKMAAGGGFIPLSNTMQSVAIAAAV